jgi:TATA-binding protein-associated factor Taf7
MFKVNDLSQMLLCTEEPPQMPDVQSPFNSQPSTSNADMKSAEETEIEAQLAKQKREKLYQYPHGILPPLKNVRKRRFRKTKKKKYMDKPEVDKEVKRLFRYLV